MAGVVERRRESDHRSHSVRSARARIQRASERGGHGHRRAQQNGQFMALEHGLQVRTEALASTLKHCIVLPGHARAEIQQRRQMWPVATPFGGKRRLMRQCHFDGGGHHPTLNQRPPGRHLHRHDLCAGRAQALHSVVHHGDHFAGHAFAREPSIKADPQTLGIGCCCADLVEVREQRRRRYGQVQRGGVQRIEASNGRIDARHVFDTACHRPHMIQRLGKREGAEARHAPIGRFQTDYATARGRKADRSTGV